MSNIEPRSSRVRHVAGIATIVTIFAATFAVGYSGRLPRVDVTVRWPDTRQSDTVRARSAGPELALVYIGSSTCGAANRADLPPAIERVKAALRRVAAANGRGFAAVGIARDRNIDAGLAHLRRFGRFDEVTTGRGWVNAAILKYVYEDIPGVAATPQVVVVDRVILRETGQRGVSDERLVVRKVGVDEIVQWLSQGVPIPDLPPRENATASQ